MMVRYSILVALLALLCLVTLGRAQEQEPIGVPVPPLGAGPWVFDTAEQHKIRVSVVTKGLSHPWALAFLPDGGTLVTERPGRLRIVRDGVLDPQPITGVPEVRTDGNGGLMDVTLHPQFADNRLVYLTYTKPVGDGKGAPAPARGRLDGSTLTDVEDLLVPDFYEGNSGLNGRVVFGRDGKLYMSTGGNIGSANVEEVAQDPTSLRGKILRLNDDGSVPPDNPFVGHEGYRPEIYTLGHRNTLGLILHPESGQIWNHENGPNGGDENQHHLGGSQLRMARREFWAKLPRLAHLSTSDARGDGVGARGLAARHRGGRHGCLHWRPVSSVEGQRLRRLLARGRNPGYRPPAAHRVQRQDRGAAA